MRHSRGRAKLAGDACRHSYQTKLKAPDAEIISVNLTSDQFRLAWNYTIHPDIPA